MKALSLCGDSRTQRKEGACRCVGQLQDVKYIKLNELRLSLSQKLVGVRWEMHPKQVMVSGKGLKYHH